MRNNRYGYQPINDQNSENVKPPAGGSGELIKKDELKIIDLYKKVGFATGFLEGLLYHDIPEQTKEMIRKAIDTLATPEIYDE